ncbi:MAG: uracil-DNA glycosylase [Anaerolineaceae bacterium]|nr:uracil-DNA glycosylase [Anaerolineaceae bacterium]
MNLSPIPKTLAELEQIIITCRRCPRLVAWREEVARTKRRAYQDWTYWGKPVPGFGDPQARVLVVGLAPGAHGSNRTGRMFTGDSSGNFLYAALHRAGFANQPTTTKREDGLALRDMYITAVVRCAPPDNKPAPAELANCLPYLLEEMRLISTVKGIVALGSIAYKQITSVYRSRGASFEELPFGHHVLLQPDGDFPWVLASYHPSRQNTQTGRLTIAMFDQIWQTVNRLLEEAPTQP